LFTSKKQKFFLQQLFAAIEIKISKSRHLLLFAVKCSYEILVS